MATKRKSSKPREKFVCEPSLLPDRSKEDFSVKGMAKLKLQSKEGDSQKPVADTVDPEIVMAG